MPWLTHIFYRELTIRNTHAQRMHSVCVGPRFHFPFSSSVKIKCSGIMKGKREKKNNTQPKAVCMVSSIPRKKMWCAYKSVSTADERGIRLVRLAAGKCIYDFHVALHRHSSILLPVDVHRIYLFMHFVFVSLCTYMQFLANMKGPSTNLKHNYLR